MVQQQKGGSFRTVCEAFLRRRRRNITPQHLTFVAVPLPSIR